MRLDGIVDVVKPVSGEQNEHLNVIGNITVQDLEVVTLAKDVDGAVTQIKNVAGNIAGKDGGDLSEITVISGAEDSVQLPAAGYYGIGKVTVKGDKNLAPENIKKGKTIFGVDGDYAPDPVKLASLSRTFSRNGAYTISTPDGYTGLRKVDIKVDVPTEVIEEVVDAVFQSKTVIPSAKAQTITPDEESGFNALSSVYVEGDSDLKSENIVEGVSIFNVNGSYKKRPLQSKIVTPNADGQTVKPDADFEGLSSVYVQGDSDLIPANIREGVNIFGVDGNYSTGQNYQDKTVRPTGKEINVSADEGFNALAKVTVEGDANLTPSKIAKGETIYGVKGDYVSPMIEVQNIVPSTDPQYIIPPDGFHGFKTIAVEAIGGGGGYADVRPNLAPLSKLTGSVSEGTSDFTQDGFRWHFNKGDATAGLCFDTSDLVVGELYTFAYKFKKTDGTLKSIGGHDLGFDECAWSLDGVTQEDGYVYPAPVANDEEEHQVVYTGFYRADAWNGDNNIYCQPNRNDATFVAFDVWNVKVERVNATPAWIPAAEDKN